MPNGEEVSEFLKSRSGGYLTSRGTSQNLHLVPWTLASAITPQVRQDVRATSYAPVLRRPSGQGHVGPPEPPQDVSPRGSQGRCAENSA